jgi:PBP1b-binding outer membrane lipoprotein LpoB
MKNLLTFGLVAWFFLVLAGCAHTPDSPGSMAKQQQTVAAPTSGTPAQETAAAQTNGTPAQETAAAQTNGTPAVEVSEMVFDFGEVTEGNDYVHAFKIRNTGTGVLVIKKIVPG